MSFPSRLKGFLKRKAFSLLELETTLSTGIKVTVKNKMDWIIYNDIFVDGDYDEPLKDLLNIDSNKLNVVNLGANVGYFDLRLAHLYNLVNSNKKIKVKAVEASPSLCNDLLQRWHRSNTDANITVDVLQGLIGYSSFETLYEFHDHGLNSTKRNNGKPINVKSINIAQVCEDIDTIHLLKCDIEGSEEYFLTHHDVILKKTHMLVIELHHEFCKPEACIRKLNSHGFQIHQIIREYEHGSLHYFKK
jgi:FkbM family methyltransferase